MISLSSSIRLLILDQRDQCPYPAATVGKALRTYVEMGGGLVINHSPGRYPEAPVDPFWNEAFAYLDMTRFHEEIADLSTMTNAGRRAVFHTDNLKVHPVTEGVGGLWLSAATSTPARGRPSISYRARNGDGGRDWSNAELPKNRTRTTSFSKPGHLAGELSRCRVRRRLAESSRSASQDNSGGATT